MAVLHYTEHPTGSYEDLRIKSPFSAELLWVSRTTFCCQHCLRDSFWSASLRLEAGWKTLIKDIPHNRHIRSGNWEESMCPHEPFHDPSYMDSPQHQNQSMQGFALCTGKLCIHSQERWGKKKFMWWGAKSWVTNSLKSWGNCYRNADQVLFLERVSCLWPVMESYCPVHATYYKTFLVRHSITRLSFHSRSQDARYHAKARYT